MFVAVVAVRASNFLEERGVPVPEGARHARAGRLYGATATPGRSVVPYKGAARRYLSTHGSVCVGTPKVWLGTTHDVLVRPRHPP